MDAAEMAAPPAGGSHESPKSRVRLSRQVALDARIDSAGTVEFDVSPEGAAALLTIVRSACDSLEVAGRAETVLWNGRWVTPSTAWWANRSSTAGLESLRLRCVHGGALTEACKECPGG